MWKWITSAVKSANDFVKGNRRRVALLGGVVSSIGEYTGFVPLTIVGSVIFLLFGALDVKDNPKEYKKLLGIKKK